MLQVKAFFTDNEKELKYVNRVSLVKPTSSGKLCFKKTCHLLICFSLLVSLSPPFIFDHFIYAFTLDIFRYTRAYRAYRSIAPENVIYYKCQEEY